MTTKFAGGLSLPKLIRLRTIESLVAHYGYVNRDLLCDLHGMAVAQCSRDIADYIDLNPDSLIYNSKTQRIEKISTFQRIFNAEQLFEDVKI